jgi:hypothetical protein
MRRRGEIKLHFHSKVFCLPQANSLTEDVAFFFGHARVESGKAATGTSTSQRDHFLKWVVNHEIE